MLKKIQTLWIAFFSLCMTLNAFAKPVVNIDETATPTITTERPTTSHQKFFITGYGELNYSNIENADDALDFNRFVLGFGYDFTDKIRLRSELEFEHAGKETELEYATIDYDIMPQINFRIGAFLLPIGYMNQNHEPTTFYSVLRPELYTFIIPTTWWEGGAGFYGELFDGLTYQIYGHSSLNFNNGSAADEHGFNAAEGIRPGRQKLTEILADDFAGSARVQYTGIKGLRIGTSGFIGQSAQGDTRVNRGLVSLIETDAKYTFEGIELEGIYAAIFNPEAGEMTTAQRTDGNIGATETIGKRMQGFLLEGAYHVFHHVWKTAPVDLVAFTRWESYDTNSAVPAGFVKDPAVDRDTVIFGLSFLPIDQIAIKADYAWRRNGSGTAANQFNVGLGYYF